MRESHAIYFRDYLSSQILISLSKQAASQAQDRPKQLNGSAHGNSPKNGNRIQRGTSPSPNLASNPAAKPSFRKAMGPCAG
jgi:hypothetical protein